MANRVFAGVALSILVLVGLPAGQVSRSPLRAETVAPPDSAAAPPAATQEAQLRYPTQITVPLAPAQPAEPKAKAQSLPQPQVQTSTAEAANAVPAPQAATPQPAAAPLTAPPTSPLTAQAAPPQQIPPAAAKPTPLQPRTAAPRLVVPPAGAATAAQSGSPAIPAASSIISLEINRGTLVRLPRAAATVFVANPEIADVQVKSPSIVYVTAKKGGETTLIAVDEDDKVLLESRVLVAHNLGRLRDSLKQLAPSRLVDVSSVGEQLVLDGTVGSPMESEDMRRLAAAVTGDEKLVINRLKIAAPVQVNLRVRVAEMTKDISKQLGFNWTLMRNVLGTTSDLAATLAVVNPASASIANKLSITGRSGSWDINTVIDAMDQENLLKILAQPNLTALSGQTASFLVGGEFPIVVPQDNNAFTIEFKKFGVSLAFAPTVLNDNRINLHVRPEVSDLSKNGAVTLQGFTIPAIATRRAETTVEVASGQSFAIAGLLREDVTHAITKWPGLADIPILGSLFRSDTFLRKESELVIIVTPYIVEPSSNSQLASPADDFRPPLAARRPRLAGPAGFQLE